MNKEDATMVLLLEFLYVAPIKGLIINLEDNIYKDGDMDFLNKELKTYTEVALKGLGKDFDLSDKAVGGVMNDKNKERFLEYFKTLLGYFENLSENS